MKIELDKKYQWNQGWANRIAHTDINAVVSELKDIEETHGEVTPDLIVESSKNKKSVLYSYFEWDNEKAANAFRLRQASQLLTRIEVKTIKDGQTKIVKAFELTTRNSGFNGNPAGYSSSSSSRKIIISACMGDLKRVKNKLIGHDLTGPVEYLDKAIEELQKIDTANIIPIDKNIPKELIVEVKGVGEVAIG